MLPKPWRAALPLLATLFVAGSLHGQGGVAPSRSSGSDRLLYEAQSWVRFGREDGLPSDSVRLVLETPDEVVWVSTEDGLAWFDGYRWRAASGPPDRPATDLAHDPDAGVLALIDRVLYVGDENGFEPLPLAPGSIPVACASSPATGHAIVLNHGADKPLRLWLPRDGASFELPEPVRMPRFTGELVRSGRGLCLANRGAAYRFDGTTWQPAWTGEAAFEFRRLSLDAEGRTGLAYSYHPLAARGLWGLAVEGGLRPIVLAQNLFAHSMDIAPGGDAVVALMSGEILVRQDGEWCYLDPVPREMRRVHHVQYRPNGELWVATESGLFLYRPTHPSIEFWNHGEAIPPVIALEYLSASDGSTWVGLQDGLEQRLADGSVVPFHDAGEYDLLRITALAEDDAGHIWVGSGSGSLPGALRWDGHEWRLFGPEDGLAASGIHKIRRDAAGRLWFLGIGTDTFPSHGTNPGCFVYDGQSFERWDTERGLIGNRVYAFAEGPVGTLWFGTYSGVTRWREGHFEHWTRARGLITDRVITLAVDTRGTAWFGHGAIDGLGTIDPGGEVGYVNVPGIGDRGKVIEVRVDSADHVWAGTDVGLLHYDRDVWSVGRADDGIRGDRAHAILPIEGGVLVGTPNGGTAVLSQERMREYPPLLELERVRVERRSAFAKWNVCSHWRDRDPERVRTRYRLGGGEWSAWSTAREASVDGLEYGEHTLELQARTFFAPFDGQILSEPFIIARPLHLRLAFILPVLGTMLLLAGLSALALGKRHRERGRRRESEAMFRQLTENIREVFWLRDATTHEVLYVSPGFAAVWGRATSAVMQSKSNWDRFVHDEDRVRVRESYLRDARRGNYEEEYRIVRSDGTVSWIRDRAFPIRDREGRVYRIAGTSDDITSQKQSLSAIEESQAQYRSLVETVPDALFLHQKGRITFANPAGVQLLGATNVEEVVGRPIFDIIHPDYHAVATERIERILRTKASAGRAEQVLLRLDGSSIVVEVMGDHVIADGEPAVQVIVRDIRERKRHEESQLLLMRELDHRVKNNLAGVMAIAQQSLHGSESLAEFERSFLGRVRALANTHETLARARWEGVSLEDILRMLMRPHVVEPARVSLAGPILVVRARAATAFSMALYELVMNATKYGALSNSSGRVRLLWSLRDGLVRVIWREAGGPRINGSVTHGMGISLVRGMVEYELGGSVAFEFAAEGLVCTLRLPAETLLESPGEVGVPREPDATVRGSMG